MTRPQAIIAPGEHRAIVNGQLTRDGVKAIAISIEDVDHIEAHWVIVLAFDETDCLWQPGEKIRKPYAVCVRVTQRPPIEEDEPPRAQLGLAVRRLDA